MASNELISFSADNIASLFQRTIKLVRDEMLDNPYIEEAFRVLKVEGYRSAIGCYWNAVIDDLRNKVIYRSLSLFNQEMKDQISSHREIKQYEDFQNFVSDDVLIEGAYRIGVIGWEASKVLRHAKETRHIFDGHPKSSSPDLLKVLSMISDCNKYVLNVEYPPQIIDISEYISIMSSDSFDRNEYAIRNALESLPDTYKNQLVHMLFSAYISKDANSIMSSNIEYVAPILWNFLNRETKKEVVRRVDGSITKGDVTCTENAFKFVRLVKGKRFLTHTARMYKIQPLVDKLARNLDNWSAESLVVRELLPYASIIPKEVLGLYVKSLTETYIGTTGHSHQYSRTDFYSDGACVNIPKMFNMFDNEAAQAFVEAITTSQIIKSRISNPVKLSRLRTLANIVRERVSDSFEEIEFLDILIDETQGKKFIKLLNKEYK